MFSSSSNDTTNENAPMNIIVDDDDADNIEEVAPTETKKRSSNEVNSTRSKASKPPIPNVSTSSASGKKRKSIYWAHYDETNVEGEIECKYCEQLLHVCSRNGTSVMKNHLQRCKKYPANMDQKQKLLSFQTKRVVKEDGSIEHVNVPSCWQFDSDFSRKELVKMIIIDELPFMFVEREGFRGFCKSLHPKFGPPSRHTIARDCYALFIDEKRKLKGFFEKVPSRVCLTTDIWTSGQNLSYMCLTAYFIDDDWNLHKRIINFSGELIGRAIEKCLIEWNLKNVLTVTVDNASSNDVAIQYLKRRLNHWGTTVLDGNYLHMRCVAHILNLVVKDGLKDLDPSIVKIRLAVRFVRSSPARLEKFKACVEEEGINEKGLVCLDVDIRWNSTFLMLECALKFRKAFSNLESKGGLHIKEMRKHGGPPNNDDWKKVGALLPFLRIFYDTTLKLSGSLYVTGNSYVSQIYGVGFLISGYCNNVDESIRNMAYQMKAKYDKYWENVDNINVSLFIALVLDPRYKLDYVEWVIRTNYDDESANMLFLKVKYTLRSLFDYYSSSVPPPKRTMEASSSVTPSSAPCDVGSNDEQRMDVNQLMSMRYKKEKETLESEKKSELDKYLSDDCEEGNNDVFEISQFWRDQQKRYPILAKMARDLLAMPVSTMASESAFSTGGRVLDSFRTSLTHRMVEALICCQDWLRRSHGPFIMEDTFLEIEELEKSIKDLALEQPTIMIDESIDASNDL